MDASERNTVGLSRVVNIAVAEAEGSVVAWLGSSTSLVLGFNAEFVLVRVVWRWVWTEKCTEAASL